MRVMRALRVRACAAPSGRGAMEPFPQVRVRRATHRKVEQLIEAAVLHERISGGAKAAQSARRRAEWLRMKTNRENWELIYEHVVSKDAILTLKAIEEAVAEVEAVLAADEKQSEMSSVTQLKSELVSLQGKIGDAKEKLNTTEVRLQRKVEQVDNLKSQAEALTRTLMADDPATAVAEIDLLIADEEKKEEEKRRKTKPKKKRSFRGEPRRGLESPDVSLSAKLKPFWYPVEFSSKLDADTLVPFDLFGTPFVLFRDSDGGVACVHDSCAHRACPLSLGKVVDGQVQCAYHGWQFDKNGECQKMPSANKCGNVKVSSLHCREKDGMIWVWGSENPEEVPDMPMPNDFALPEGFQLHAEITLDVPVEHGLLLENLMDLAHAPFTHTSTFAKGWSVPEFVDFKEMSRKALVGDWSPYPIEMAFGPPCVVLSLIGLEKPGEVSNGMKAEQCKNHLHQMHVCIPSKPGHTRLMYRMGLDFMDWVAIVPGIERFWNYIAGEVLGEDLRLVLGQQERMLQGDQIWGNPVQYDKLGIKYRKWRNRVQMGDEEARMQAIEGPQKIDAGNLFLEELEPEEEDGCIIE